MRYSGPTRFESAAAFRAHLEEIGCELELDLELSGAGGPLGRPLEHAGRVLANRFAIQPMEGWDGTPDGLPSDLTRRRWRRFGRSGAKLIWGGEAFAVTRDGRANPHQLFLDEGNAASGEVERGLAALRGEIVAGHKEIGEDPDGLLVGLQLTHSGRFARPTADGPAPRIAFHHPVLDGRVGLDGSAPLLSDGELEAIGEAFVRSARLAREAGFDFVDVKCCHGYLQNELLAARARPGPYGGDFAGRTRFFRRVVDGIRAECPELEVAVRFSAGDVFPFATNRPGGTGEPAGWKECLPYEHGFGVDPEDPRRFDLSEPKRLLGLLGELGIRLVNASLGSPYYCPHIQRPAAYPPSDGYLPPRDPLFEVALHVNTVRRLKADFPDMVFVGSGYTYLQEYLPHVAQRAVDAGYVDFCGLGRMVLSYPELPRDVLSGAPLRRKILCRTFSDCTTGPRNGLPSGCYPLDPGYRSRPEALELKRIKEGLRER